VGGRLQHFQLLEAPLKTCPFWSTELPEHSREDASLRQLISETEALYITSFTDQVKLDNTSSAAKAQRELAMREMEVARDGGAAAWANLFTTWQLGVVVGVVAIVAVVLGFLATYTDAASVSPAVLVPLYRLSGMSMLIAWVWAASFTVLLAVHFDAVKSLNFNPRMMGRSSASFFAGFCSMTVLWSVTLAVATAAVKGAPLLESSLSYLAVYPVLLCAVGAGILVCFEVFTGGWLSLCLWATIRAPALPVAFKDVFIADQLLSFETTIRDAFFVVCFLGVGDYTNNEALVEENACVDVTGRAGPFLVVLPAFWRVMQCLRLYADSCPSA